MASLGDHSESRLSLGSIRLGCHCPASTPDRPLEIFNENDKLLLFAFSTQRALALGVDAERHTRDGYAPGTFVSR